MKPSGPFILLRLFILLMIKAQRKQCAAGAQAALG